MKFLSVLLCIVLLFTGCSQDTSTELSNRLIIEAIGIDSDENGYKVSVLALNTLQTGSAGSTDSPDGIAKVFTAKGNSIADAFAQIDLISAQIPLYSQARVLLIGKEVAENQPLSALNFFIREYTTRDDIPVAVAETTANKIITADLGKNLLVSKVIDNLLSSGIRNGQTVRVPLYSFISRLLNKTDAAYLPVLKVEKNAQKKNELRSAGVALFANDNYTATLKAATMDGFLYANNLVDSALLEIEYKDKNISLSVRKIKTKTKINKKDPSVFSVDISFSCDIIEHNSMKQDLDEQDIRQIKILAQEKIKKYIEDFLYFTLHDCGCDSLGFGKRIRNKYPTYYEQISEKYASFLKNIQTTVRAEGSVHRPGREVLLGK